jgi:hypothetical protein
MLIMWSQMVPRPPGLIQLKASARPPGRKVVLLARVKNGTRYDVIPVEIRNARPVEIEDTTTYYLRYTQNGKRRTEAVGADLNRALVAYQNRELNHTRANLGLSPIAELSSTSKSGRMKIAHAVAVYLQNLSDNIKTGERSKGGFGTIRDATLYGYADVGIMRSGCWHVHPVPWSGAQ